MNSAPPLPPETEAKLDALYARVKAALPLMDRSTGFSVSNLPAETLERTVAGLMAAAVGFTTPEPKTKALFSLPTPDTRRQRPGRFDARLPYKED